MDSKKYIGMDVHKESISIVVNSAGKIVMECVIQTKANMILQFFDGLPGLEDLRESWRGRKGVESRRIGGLMRCGNEP